MKWVEERIPPAKSLKYKIIVGLDITSELFQLCLAIKISLILMQLSVFHMESHCQQKPSWWMWVVVFQPGSICPLTLSSPALNSSNTIPITVIKLIALVIVFIGSVALNIALPKSNTNPRVQLRFGDRWRNKTCVNLTDLSLSSFFFSVTTTIFLFIYSHQQTLYNSFCSCPPSRNTLSPSPLVLHRHTTIKTISVSS